MKDSWQDVNTSTPDDGEEVLVYSERGVSIATFDEDKRFAANGWIGSSMQAITHWQKLEGPFEEPLGPYGCRCQSVKDRIGDGCDICQPERAADLS